MVKQKEKGKKKKKKEAKKEEEKKKKERRELCQFIVVDSKTGKERNCKNKGLSSLYFDKLNCCSYCSIHWKLILKYGMANLANIALQKDIPKMIAFKDYSKEDYYTVFPEEFQAQLDVISKK